MIETFISNMMRINVMARLWHWNTSVAQHHTTFEQFLTGNETLTDSFVESAMGNDLPLNFSQIGVKGASMENYSLDEATSELKKYRSTVFEIKQSLEKKENPAHSELVTILDDVTELSSKTLYLLKLK